jgi:transcriptional regulator
MVIFSEPHAYISPSHYSNPQSVPTWNYMAIHAYGRVTDLEGEDASAVLEAMIQAFEPEYLAKWKDMPEKFVSGMMAGIRAFEIQVTELQGKRKLSQNKPLQDQEKIAAHLLESQDTVIQWIGKEMMQQLNDHSQPE